MYIMNIYKGIKGGFLVIGALPQFFSRNRFLTTFWLKFLYLTYKRRNFD